MRNDAYDELNELPSLTAEPKHSAAFGQPVLAVSQTQARGIGLLWALVIALSGALVALGMWSQQQVELMAQQLVATQESFAHISEQAAGRIQAISGQVVAAESSVTSESEQLKMRLNKLEQQLKEAQLQLTAQRQGLDELASADQTHLLQGQKITLAMDEQVKAVKTLATGVAAQSQRFDQIKSHVSTLTDQQQALKTAQGQSAVLAEQVKTLKEELAEVRKGINDTQRIGRVEQDVMVLRAQLDSAPSPAQGAPLAEFDAYRAQVTRQLNALNSQVHNLQQQLDAR